MSPASKTGLDEAGGKVVFRRPTVDDGREMWRIVRESDALDPNSRYAYLLVGTHFSGTSLVAEIDGRVVGFVAAYRPPTGSEAVFVWQIGVDRSARRRGIARRLLEELVRLPDCRSATHLESTVTPGNAPSRRLFESFAKSQGAELSVRERFTHAHFGGEGHEEEHLFRIGPLDGDRE